MYTVNPEIFARFLFSRYALKDLFATLKFQLWHDLPISVNDRVISPFREDFVFTKFREKKLAKISEFTVCYMFQIACAGLYSL